MLVHNVHVILFYLWDGVVGYVKRDAEKQIVTPLRMHSRVTVLGLCVCVCLSVTTQAATAFVCSPQNFFHGFHYIKRFRSRDTVLFVYPG